MWASGSRREMFRSASGKVYVAEAFLPVLIFLALKPIFLALKPT
jgi:hypothetical protein